MRPLNAQSLGRAARSALRRPGRAFVLFVRVVLVGAALASAAMAASDQPVAQVIRQLEAQGYAVTEIKRTWLGRTRILAQSATARREIVLVPRTGEILRDVLRPRDSSGVLPGAQPLVRGERGGSSSSTSGSGGPGDDGDDKGDDGGSDNDDDDDDDDNKGDDRDRDDNDSDDDNDDS